MRKAGALSHRRGESRSGVGGFPIYCESKRATTGGNDAVERCFFFFHFTENDEGVEWLRVVGEHINYSNFKFYYFLFV